MRHDPTNYATPSTLKVRFKIEVVAKFKEDIIKKISAMVLYLCMTSTKT